MLRSFISGSPAAFLRSHHSAASQAKVLIVPDKDADGLDAGVILRRTLIMLGLQPSLVEVHLIGKNSTVHDEVERTAMQAKDPKYIIVVDQGSRAAPPVVDSETVKSLIIDHHLSDEFPKDALVRGYILPRPPRLSANPNERCPRSCLHVITLQWQRQPY